MSMQMPSLERQNLLKLAIVHKQHINHWLRIKRGTFDREIVIVRQLDMMFKHDV